MRTSFTLQICWLAATLTTGKSIIANTCLIVEVLSPSTERIDRREKFLAYTTLESLKEYILISQESQTVTLFRRKNNWKTELFTGNDIFSLNCLDCTLAVEQVYEEID